MDAAARLVADVFPPRPPAIVTDQSNAGNNVDVRHIPQKHFVPRMLAVRTKANATIK